MCASKCFADSAAPSRVPAPRRRTERFPGATAAEYSGASFVHGLAEVGCAVRYIIRIKQLPLPDFFFALRFGERVPVPAAVFTMARSMWR